MVSDYQRLSLLVSLFDAGQQLLGNAISAHSIPDEAEKEEYLAKVADQRSQFIVLKDQVLALTGPL